MVAALLLGAVLVVLNQTLLSPGLPSIMQEMGVGETTVQWLTSAYSLAEAVVIPTAAWFMGRFSTRRLFVGGMALFAAGSLVAAVAPAFPVLLLGRVMQACATGVLMVAVMALILLAFPRERRGQAMGLVSLVIGFAPAVGPTVGGLLVDAMGWRALFCAVAAAAVAVAAFAHRALADGNGFPRTSMDLASVALSSLGLVALLYGLSSFSSSSHAAVCIALVAAGAVLVGLFVRRQLRLEEPLLRFEVLRSRRYRTSFSTVALIQAILIGLNVLMPLYIQNALGFSATVSGMITLPGAVLGALAGLAAGRLFDRSGIRGVGLAGAAVLLAGSLGMFAYGAHSTALSVVVAHAATSVGLLAVMTPVNTWGMNSLDNDLVQHATAASNTMNQVGGSLGTALIMSFSALGTSAAFQGTEAERAFAGYHLSFAVVLALAAVVVALVVLFVRDRADDRAPDRSAGTTVDERGVRHTVAEVMDDRPLVIPASAHMGEAARILAESGASGAVVEDADGTVRGFLSNSDVLRFFGDEMQTAVGTSGFVALRSVDSENVRDRAGRLADINVLEMATVPVVSVAPDVSFEEACRILADRRLKELPVVEDGRLVGALHRRSLMQAVASLLDRPAAASES